MDKLSDNGGAAAEAVDTESGGEEAEEIVEEVVGDSKTTLLKIQKSIESLHEKFDSLNTAQEKTVLDVHQNHETIESLQSECRNLKAIC